MGWVGSVQEYRNAGSKNKDPFTSCRRAVDVTIALTLRPFPFPSKVQRIIVASARAIKSLLNYLYAFDTNL
ncbi:MAG TPA: hypothetical protein VFI70_10210 [Nitrososphaeraceae archaeon]|nr:hypothetical protein [Nitrososphaeraceae archaeon]